MTNNIQHVFSPLVKGFLLGVVLETTFVDEEFHPLKEGSGDSWWLLPE